MMLLKLKTGIKSQGNTGQEYEASFETAEGRIYDDYAQANQASETIQSHEQLLWHHDFNPTQCRQVLQSGADNLYTS